MGAVHKSLCQVCIPFGLEWTEGGNYCLQINHFLIEGHKYWYFHLIGQRYRLGHHSMLSWGLEGALHPKSVSLVNSGEYMKPAKGRDSKPVLEILIFSEFLFIRLHILTVLFPILLVLELST